MRFISLFGVCGTAERASSGTREQATEDGCGGNGYCITPAGEIWLRESGQFDFVPIEPDRFARQLAEAGRRFGPGFLERSQEAIKCYVANAYLACCAMCGAATESILLSVAVAKSGNEERVLGEYLSSGGRGRIEKMLLGQQPDRVQAEFRGYTSLLKYWRDSSAHGKKASIGDNEAYTSLALLLRFAHFVNDGWGSLTETHPHRGGKKHVA